MSTGKLSQNQKTAMIMGSAMVAAGAVPVSAEAATITRRVDVNQLLEAGSGSDSFSGLFDFSDLLVPVAGNGQRAVSGTMKAYAYSAADSTGTTAYSTQTENINYYTTYYTYQDHTYYYYSYSHACGSYFWGSTRYCNEYATRPSFYSVLGGHTHSLRDETRIRSDTYTDDVFDQIQLLTGDQMAADVVGEVVSNTTGDRFYNRGASTTSYSAYTTPRTVVVYDSQYGSYSYTYTQIRSRSFTSVNRFDQTNISRREAFGELGPEVALNEASLADFNDDGLLGFSLSQAMGFANLQFVDLTVTLEQFEIQPIDNVPAPGAVALLGGGLIVGGIGRRKARDRRKVIA